MSTLTEAVSVSSAKDGGFIFQAIVSHNINWEIVNGETKIDPAKINTKLHTVDIFPDIKFTEGSAISTYIILSEVNILKRKFELASEAIKKILIPAYATEITASTTSGESADQKKIINNKHFNGTTLSVQLTTDHIVLREVSTSSLDTGFPKISLKISTGMVDTLNGAYTPTWDKFKIVVSGSKSLTILNTKETPISEIKEFDEIENTNDIIIRTIIPSLILDFKGDKVDIETHSNRSTRIATYMLTDYKNLFNVQDSTLLVKPK